MVVRGIRCENCPNETFHYYCLTDPNGNGQETHAKCPICKADIELSLRVRINLKPDQVETLYYLFMAVFFRSGLLYCIGFPPDCE